MELSEIAKLYSNEAPLSIEVISDDDRGDSQLLFVTADIEYKERALRLNVCDYVFGTIPRIKQAARTVEAYNNAGFNALRIIPNIIGELVTSVSFRGRNCNVYATERPETKTDCPIEKTSSFAWRDEYLTAAARIASLGLEGTELSAFEPFEPINTPDSEIEDCELVYFNDLKSDTEKVFPEMLDMISNLNRVFTENRHTLRLLWDKLPKSVFNGEINEIGIDALGYLKQIRDFIHGGKETNINYLFRLSFWLADFEVGFDNSGIDFKELRENRLKALCRNIRFIAKRYRFTDEEIEAAPYVFKNRLISTHYYWEFVRFADGDPQKLSNFRDFLENRLMSNEIDFESLMRI